IHLTTSIASSYSHVAPRDLHSFPTRRSSDLLANSTNNAVRQNPYALPVAGVFTPKRPNEEFFAALRTSTATDGRTPFEKIEHPLDRKSTRLNSSHRTISYAVFCLKKKNQIT